MENNLNGDTQAVAAKSRRLPVWVIVVSFVILVGFMWLIGWGLKRAYRGAIAIGDQVPAFSMTTFDGQAMTSTDFAGKVVVLNFWASWCKPCEQEASELEQAYQFYKDRGDVVFIGLAYVDTEPKSLEYLNKFGITYPNGPDMATKVSQMFRITGVPETFVIDRSGKLAYFKAGPFTSLDEILAVVDSVVNK